MIKPNEISDILKQQLEEVDTKVNFEEVGTVLGVGDGVAPSLVSIMYKPVSFSNLKMV